MKRIGMIFFGALAIVMAGCSKNAAPEQPSAPLENAWMYDESLPVPIQFGMSSGVGLQTKTTMIENWSDLEYPLGIFALDLEGDLDNDTGIYLKNERAEAVEDVERGKYLIKFEESKYYPYSSDRNFSFFGYYPRFGTAPACYRDSIRIPIPVDQWGKHDILCASSFAERQYVKKGPNGNYIPAVYGQDATAYYDGFNAAYIRHLNRNNLYEQKMPNLSFQHKTTCFEFEAYLTGVSADKVTSTDQIPVIQSIEIKGPSIYEKAYLTIARNDLDAAGMADWSGALRVEGKTTSLKLGGKNAANMNVTIGGDPNDPLKYVLPHNRFFLQPMDTKGQLTIVVTLLNPFNSEVEVFEADFPKLPVEILSFEEGKYYPFTITINYFAGIEISADIEPWENGFAPGTENDNIGEDAPSIL